MKIKHCIAGLVLFLGVLACAVPGLSQPVPIPTFDPGPLSTTVELTSSAAMAKTVAAASPTPTLAPTESVMATPKVSSSGTSLFQRDDKTTVFTDYQAGIQIIVPAGWLAVRLNEPEYYDAWVLPELSNSSYQHALATIQELNPNEVRLFMIDMQEGHLPRGFVTNVDLSWYENDEFSLEDDSDLLSYADTVSDKYSDMEILTVKLSCSVSGIPIGVFTSKMHMASLIDGGDSVAFFKSVIVKARTGMLKITLITPEELHETVFSTLDAMIETITIVKE